MAQTNLREVARATLLDRLVDLQPDVSTEPKPLRTLDRYGLRYSVRRELERLLNTRCSFPPEILEQQGRTVFNYGIPDFSHLSPQNPYDHKFLSREMAKTIAAYEPRLQDVRIIIEEYDPKDKALYARINAVITVEGIRDPVSFPFVVQMKDREFNLNVTRGITT